MGTLGRSTLSDGDFFDVCFFQVEILVNDGWYSFLLMIMLSVQIVGNLVFQLVLIHLSGISVWPIVVFLVAMLVPAPHSLVHHFYLRYFGFYYCG